MTINIHSHRWNPSADTPVKEFGVYILHGIGEHSARYGRFTKRLTQLGYRVGSHDHPGHGKSGGKRGVIRTPVDLEVTAMEQLAKFEEETGSKTILFGHSLGGLVGSSMVLNFNADVHGLILSAPAFKPVISPYNRAKLAVLNLLAPKFSQELRFEPEKLTHDKEEQQKAIDDPLNHRYKSVGIVMWLVKTGDLTLSRAGSINIPTLMLMPGDDEVVNRKAFQQFSASVTDTCITEYIYSDYKHEILNETPERRERVLCDIENWLQLQQST